MIAAGNIASGKAGTISASRGFFHSRLQEKVAGGAMREYRGPSTQARVPADRGMKIDSWDSGTA